jgi:hypothetical protein
MTPLDYATILARSGILRDRAEAVGIIARGLSDESPKRSASKHHRRSTK